MSSTGRGSFSVSSKPSTTSVAPNNKSGAKKSSDKKSAEEEQKIDDEPLSPERRASISATLKVEEHVDSALAMFGAGGLKMPKLLTVQEEDPQEQLSR